MYVARDIFKIITQVAQDADTPAYVVGGFVRDLLLKRQKDSPDIDIVVEGSGIVFARQFDQAMQQVGSLVEFPDFDTARYVLPASEEKAIEVEFAGARSEKYRETSRKPAVVHATLEQDLARRDFTINAMALPTSAFSGVRQPSLPALLKKLVDPFNGQNDLKEKILRTPLDPEVTFSDDPLRMLRAVRFASELHFTIDPTALGAIHRNRERLKIISGERIQEELFKLLATATPSIGLILLFQTHVLDVILPEVANLDGVEEIYGHQHKNNLVHSFKVVDNVAEQSPKVWLRLAGLLHDIGKPGTKHFVSTIGWTFHGHEHLGKKMVFAIARRLKFSKDLTEYLAKLIRWHLQPISLMDEGITDSAVRRLIVTMGDLLDDLLILGRSDITTGNPNKKERRLKNYDQLKIKIAEVLERDKLASFQSPFRGDEIMAAAGLKPGPTVGKIKNIIEEAILDGIIPNDYAAAKMYFEKIKDTYVAQAADWERTSS